MINGVDIHHILMMGGYGVYVWSAYAITLTVFVINFVASYREHRRIKKTIKHYLTRVSQST
jgi:heme exporter protein CcmD